MSIMRTTQAGDSTHQPANGQTCFARMVAAQRTEDADGLGDTAPGLLLLTDVQSVLDEMARGHCVQGMAAELSKRFAMAIPMLVKIMDDPAAEPRERIQAARLLKKCLAALQRLAESQHTSPELRKTL